MERLREVLAYRWLRFGLRETAELVGDPSADTAAHLRRTSSSKAFTATGWETGWKWASAGKPRLRFQAFGTEGMTPMSESACLRSGGSRSQRRRRLLSH